MAIAMMVEELDGGVLVRVVTKEESEVESELQRHFEVAVVFHKKQQQPSSVLEEEAKDDKVGKEEKDQEEEKQQEKAKQRRLPMSRGGDRKQSQILLSVAYS